MYLLTLAILFTCSLFALQDGTIVHKEKFEPHIYETLDAQDIKNVSKEEYEAYCTWYRECSDADFFKIKYISDGLTVMGILAQPKQVRDHAHPLVVYNRGGFQEMGKVTVYTLKNKLHFLVKNNYIVLASQYRGNDGSEGKDQMGGDDINDVLNLFKVAENLPAINIKEAYMFGNSRGGLMTYRAIQLKAPVKAAAVTSGFADCFDFVECNPIYEQAVFKTFPNLLENKKAEYTKRSPVLWANEIAAPILLFHAEDDALISVQQSKKLHPALPKTSKLVIYQDGGHGLGKHLEDIQKQILEWFK